MLSLGQAHIRPMVSPCSQQIGHSFSSHFTDQTYLEKTTIIIDSERKVQPGANWPQPQLGSIEHPCMALCRLKGPQHHSTNDAIGCSKNQPTVSSTWKVR